MHFHILAAVALAGLVVADPLAEGSRAEGQETAAAAGPIELDSTPIESTTLEKRSANPWIGSHFLPGCRTTGEVLPNQMGNRPQSNNKYLTGPRPELTANKCQPFTAGSPFIGVMWGAGSPQFNELLVYNNAQCNGDPIYKLIRNGAETGACFHRKQAKGMAAVKGVGQGLFMTPE